MSVEMLEFATDDGEAGFRLNRVEVYNWGTFDGRITTLRLDGLNTLLTGENGSGKSTFVDALTSLLVPSQRIAYNRAAGAEARERDLRSYVLGYHRSEYNEVTGTSKPVPLRGANTYSVILGVFTNRAFGQVVTLAQVFWPAESGQPSRMFVSAEQDLSIDPTFRSFTKGIRELRAQLRAAGAEVHEHFGPYGAWFRRRLGIQSEQALDLFHQTVSMKAVGNLTEFVRTHMLDVEPVKPRIDALVTHFDDLTQAHGAVLRAKRQIELLAPMLDDHRRHDEETKQRAALDHDRRSLRHYFAMEKLALVDRSIERLRVELVKAGSLIERRRAERNQASDDEKALRAAVRSNGGDELQRLDEEIAGQGRERDTRRGAAERFATAARAAGFAAPETEDDFVDLQQRAAEQRAARAADDAALRERVTELEVEMRRLRAEHGGFGDEIENLRTQRGNISRDQIELRARLCGDLGLDEALVPFAGELVRVADGDGAWEGAAERLLRNFALSMLVADAHYATVQRWVDERHLCAKLVYFRVPPVTRRVDGELHPAALFHKLELRPDLDHTQRAWLEAELQRRAGVVCCDTPEQFRRERAAITAAGQIKGGNDRHEKDDRWRIDDRSRYVLGWVNESKINALRSRQRALEPKIQDIAGQHASADRERAKHVKRAEALAQLHMVEDFRTIDWQRIVADTAILQKRRGELLAASDRLRTLESQLEEAVTRHEQAEEAFDEANGKAATLDGRLSDFRDERRELIEELEEFGAPLDAAVLARLAERAAGLALDASRKTSHLDQLEARVREQLAGEIDAADKRLSRLAEKINGQMHAFRHEFPAETHDLDASLDAAPGYAELLCELQVNDLPRFETQFAELLTENTLREIASFQAHLHKERADILERVDKINASLATIEYNAGRYIALVLEPSRDIEIRDFQSDLRACTEGTFTGGDDPAYAETKFMQVRAIIDRFKGRPDLAEADRRWTTKVTDVRNWCTFAASERWQVDHAEYEHYSDSGGKSGGQKEKLAYTVLAASLAYQFGLELGEVRSRSFRFVAIDEAFGRADAEATKFGLELFQKLHLQLLVVTPLRGISIIEPYVHRVGFVSRSDERSRITNLTIEDYRKQRAQRAAGDIS